MAIRSMIQQVPPCINTDAYALSGDSTQKIYLPSCIDGPKFHLV